MSFATSFGVISSNASAKTERLCADRGVFLSVFLVVMLSPVGFGYCPGTLNNSGIGGILNSYKGFSLFG